MKKAAIGSLLLVCVLVCLPLAAKEYHVAPTGSDSNPGTAARPFRTIQRAADAVSPGDTVIVADGTYSNSSESGQGSKLVRMSRGGNPGAWVTFRAEHKWGAVLDGLNNNTAEGWTFASGASYVRVQGFEIKGFSDSGMSNWGGGQNLQIAGNNIHDIGRYCTDIAHGRVGVFVHTGPVVVEENEIHDIGRYAPGENGCKPAKPYYQNQDHGVYIDRGSDITVRNNLFYNNQHGWSIHVYPHPVSNLTIANNTFAFGSPWHTGQIVLAAEVTNARIENNIFYKPKSAGIYFHPSDRMAPGSDSIVISGNVSTGEISELYAPLSSLKPVSNPRIPGVNYSDNRAHTDPGLANPAAFDFRLTGQSRAAGAGARLPDGQE